MAYLEGLRPVFESQPSTTMKPNGLFALDATSFPVIRSSIKVASAANTTSSVTQQPLAPEVAQIAFEF